MLKKYHNNMKIEKKPSLISVSVKRKLLVSDVFEKQYNLKPFKMRKLDIFSILYMNNLFK